MARGEKRRIEAGSESDAADGQQEAAQVRACNKNKLDEDGIIKHLVSIPFGSCQ